MKKDIILSLQKLSLLVLFMACLFNLPAAATPTPNLGGKKSKTLVKDDSTKVIFSNWINEMKDLCVFLNRDQLVEMTVNVVTQVTKIEQFPDLHYEYSFNNSPFQVSDQLVEADFVPYREYDGVIAYIATFTHFMDYTDLCITPETTLSIDYEIRLVTPDGAGGFEAYPVAEHIGTLFPGNTQLGTLNGGGPSIEMGDKVVCCRQRGSLSEVEARQTAPKQGLSQVQIDPNPFSDQLNIETPLLQNASTTVRIFDITGKVWYQQPTLLNADRTSKQTISTAHFPPGLYFYKIDEEIPVKLIKTE